MAAHAAAVARMSARVDHLTGMNHSKNLIIASHCMKSKEARRAWALGLLGHIVTQSSGLGNCSGASRQRGLRGGSPGLQTPDSRVVRHLPGTSEDPRLVLLTRSKLVR